METRRGGTALQRWGRLVARSLVLVAGTYTCHDTNAATTAQGNFFTTASRLAIPKCKDGNRVLCSPI